MTWTHFYDMHSGGGAKLDWDHIYIEAPEDEAKAIFAERFGRDPDNETCNCCGGDYSISEEPTLAEATGAERGCAYERVDGEWRMFEKPDSEAWNAYSTLDDYLNRSDVLTITAPEILLRCAQGVIPTL